MPKYHLYPFFCRQHHKQIDDPEQYNSSQAYEYLLLHTLILLVYLYFRHHDSRLGSPPHSPLFFHHPSASSLFAFPRPRPSLPRSGAKTAHSNPGASFLRNITTDGLNVRLRYRCAFALCNAESVDGDRKTSYIPTQCQSCQLLSYSIYTFAICRFSIGRCPHHQDYRRRSLKHTFFHLHPVCIFQT